MAEDDIYGNKNRYENFLAKIEDLTRKPKRGNYYCKNPTNLNYLQYLESVEIYLYESA